ncbi:MAG: hypothetical protein U9M89_01545 [Patescibacteria group bacterium]|nr:hypothetical protein [Patescibacteria group bacterium]
MEEQNNLQPEENTQKNIDLIEWKSREFQSQKRDWKWYAIVSVVLVLVIALALYFSQWLVAAVILMVGVVLFLSNRIAPRMMNYRIDENGVTINDHLVEYGSLKGFWVVYVENKVYLNLISTTRLAPVITAEIDEGKVESIKKALGKSIPELDEKNEDWIDKINRLLKV